MFRAADAFGGPPKFDVVMTNASSSCFSISEVGGLSKLADLVIEWLELFASWACFGEEFLGVLLFCESSRSDSFYLNSVVSTSFSLITSTAFGSEERSWLKLRLSDDF